ncbi:16S rRNA (guanine(527)-N(7))-methyltransferase RsmG [Methylocystis bryophila]|uniref:Ribosomal RNA small subunit methyltransferase G n=1 Tax=Methylocystis bryophila TaxID=655015 RepID=A0A1W6MUN7_9HYPH|nr:16S rRNA (guanine(527)-N(7))-methyltransferase RsmG [Methylocystis bryophila]ARN81320.1 16S rRNA (guanine(527)-N(7))-methyltransferase RsmG [Methylocystis bryophila]BDV37295.1 ribosomal RNA small subunit methyltransferase G [Methylocystis bryophila]
MSSADRAEALRLCPALRDIQPQLEIYERMLREWNPRINLVSASTLNAVWTRHFADSAQLHELLPHISRWVDLGSGAGFPGMVLALHLKGRPGASVTLIESDQRKAAFLRAVSRETGAPAKVICGRIESELPKLAGESEGVSARALAPLQQLLDWSAELLLKNATGAFLKGENWRDELTGAKAPVNFSLVEKASRTHPSGRIVLAMRRDRPVSP